jgi:D-alanine-D-alanine ligase
MNFDSDQKRILIVCHPDLVPITQTKKTSKYPVWKTEGDVVQALRKEGHSVEFVGIGKSLRPLKMALREKSYDIVFNLLEEFSENPTFECVLPSFLEESSVPYTGCSPTPLLACRMKSTTKWLLKHQGILTPNFLILDQRASPVPHVRKLDYPAIVKLADEDASLGLVKKSVVQTPAQAQAAIRRLRKMYGGRVIVERFIAGREFHLTVYCGNGKIHVLHPLETIFGKAKRPETSIATEKVKWSAEYRKQNLIRTRDVGAEEGPLIERLKHVAAKVAEALFIDAYARIDVRVDKDGRIFVIDVNPNPDIGLGFEVANSFRKAGISYREMLNLILAQAGARTRDSEKNLRISRRRA